MPSLWTNTGCQAWCFNRFTVFEAIEKTALAGGQTIEFFPGQRLPEGGGLDPNASDAAIAAVKDACQKAGIRPVAFGVTGFSSDEASARKTFEFARKLGLRAITCEPAADAFDLLDRLVREFDIQIAVHNHPRTGNPSYRYWDPRYTLGLLARRDPRLGLCADMGHLVRSGLKPVEILRAARGRVHGLHLKDLSAAAPNGQDVPFGTGVSDVASMLDELRRQRFDGVLSVEYESKWENNVPDIAACLGFLRGYAAARR